jgi:hypothetical protein
LLEPFLSDRHLAWPPASWDWKDFGKTMSFSVELQPNFNPVGQRILGRESQINMLATGLPRLSPTSDFAIFFVFFEPKQPGKIQSQPFGTLLGSHGAHGKSVEMSPVNSSQYKSYAFISCMCKSFIASRPRIGLSLSFLPSKEVWGSYTSLAIATASKRSA